MTGRQHYLSKSTTDEAKARQIFNEFRVQVAQQQNARTKATLAVAMTEWLRSHDVEQNTRQGYEGYLRRYIGPAIGKVAPSKLTAKVLEDFYAELRRCRLRCDGRPFVEHRAEGPHECREVRHRWPPGRPTARTRVQHDCQASACVVVECRPHECRPLSAQTIRQIHFAISSALSAAVRWEWIKSNPAAVAKKPRQPTPQPKPPTADQAARIVTAAWAQDEAWGTLVWLVMVTGVRRAELLALRWQDVDLAAGMLSIRRNYVWVGGRGVEKDTKTHQMRRIALDPATVEVLTAHREDYEAMVRQLGLEPPAAADDPAFLFSYEAAHDRPCNPSGVTHRYAAMCAKLGIDSHLHALRHYSATELQMGGIALDASFGSLCGRRLPGCRGRGLLGEQGTKVSRHAL